MNNIENSEKLLKSFDDARAWGEGALFSSADHASENNFVALARLNDLMGRSGLSRSFSEAQSNVSLSNVLMNVQRATQQAEEHTLYGGTPEGGAFLKQYKTLMESHAVYIPFTVRPPPGHATFTNKLFICDSVHGVKSSDADKKIAKFHEQVHLAQWNEHPTLHATPYNVATNKVLTLTDAIVCTLLTEQEAYAKQVFLTWLAGVTDPDLREKANRYGLGLETFEESLARSNDVSKVLLDAGRYSMAQTAMSTKYSMFDHYCQQAINAYTSSGYLNDPTNNATFVRLGDDVQAFGKVFGVQSLDHYGSESYRNILSRFSSETRAQITAFNAKHGIYYEADLPSFRESLALDETTPELFMEGSKRLMRTPSVNPDKERHPQYAYALEMSA